MRSPPVLRVRTARERSVSWLGSVEGVAGNGWGLTVEGDACEDEADDWWVQWGMLRERAFEQEDGKGEGEKDEEEEEAPRKMFDFSRMSVLVTSTENPESSQ